MSLRWPPKDPDEVLDYKIDWSARLVDDDTIVGSEWVQVPDDLTIDSDDFDDTSATVWLSGGVIGKNQRLTNRVTTAAGRVMDQSVLINLAEK